MREGKGREGELRVGKGTGAVIMVGTQRIKQAIASRKHVERESALSRATTWDDDIRRKENRFDAAGFCCSASHVQTDW